jgi:hypothetical protein
LQKLIIQFIWAKRSDLDPVQLFRIQIRTSQNFQDQTGSISTTPDHGAMKLLKMFFIYFFPLSTSCSLTLFKNAFVLCLDVSGCIVRIEVKCCRLTRIRLNAM